jgi:hypothetical protein
MKTSKKQSGRFSVYYAALQWSNAFQSDIGNFRLNLVNTTVLSGWASLLRIGFDAVGDRVSDVLLGDHAGNVAPTGDPAPAHDHRHDRVPAPHAADDAGTFKMDGVDAISSASVMTDVPARVAEIDMRLDRILDAHDH